MPKSHAPQGQNGSIARKGLPWSISLLDITTLATGDATRRGVAGQVFLVLDLRSRGEAGNSSLPHQLSDALPKDAYVPACLPEVLDLLVQVSKNANNMPHHSA